MGYPILGPAEVVSRINVDDLRKYSSEHYNANNMVFAAVGNASHEKLIETGISHFLGFKASKTSERDIKYDYIGGSHSDVRDLEQVHAIVGFDGVSSLDEDYYTMAIFSSILGGGMSSRLFQEVREKRGLVYSIYSFSSSYRHNGVFGVYAATTSDKLSELSDVLANESLDMGKNISEKEFNRTKAQFRASLLMSYENNATSCEQLVNQTMIFGRPLGHNEVLEKLNAVTINGVKKITNRILSSRSSVVTVGRCDCSPVILSIQSNGLQV
jgi:predicted Zn-dependent peptidase